MSSTVQKIADEVRALPSEQLDEFLAWVAEFESGRMDDWDEQLARDSAPDGRLQGLLKEAGQEIAAGKVKPLDEIIDHN
jgi:hypothetical protein